jgi:hypothetical protein
MSLKKVSVETLKSELGTVNLKNDFSVEIKTNENGSLYFTNGELYIMFNAKTEDEGMNELCNNIIDCIQNYYNVPASKLKSSMSKDINSALKRYIKDYEIF